MHSLLSAISSTCIVVATRHRIFTKTHASFHNNTPFLSEFHPFFLSFSPFSKCPYPITRIILLHFTDVIRSVLRIRHHKLVYVAEQPNTPKARDYQKGDWKRQHHPILFHLRDSVINKRLMSIYYILPFSTRCIIFTRTGYIISAIAGSRPVYNNKNSNNSNNTILNVVYTVKHWLS